MVAELAVLDRQLREFLESGKCSRDIWPTMGSAVSYVQHSSVCWHLPNTVSSQNHLTEAMVAVLQCVLRAS